MWGENWIPQKVLDGISKGQNRIGSLKTIWEDFVQEVQMPEGLAEEGA